MNKEFEVVIFDTETTGLLAPKAQGLEAQPSIIEFYGSKWRVYGVGEYEKIGEFETFLKPPAPISAEITRITGITQEQVENAPKFIKVWRELAKFMVGVDRLVAHNLPYDLSMLANELTRVGKVVNFPWPWDHVCTVQASMPLEQRRLSLTNLHHHLFSEAFADAHRARNDVEALERCYFELCKRGHILWK